MEHKIGEIFEYNGEWYQCVKSNGTCNGCAGKFQPYSFCNGFEECVGKIFKKLKKVGEPYEHYEKFYQCYKLPMETEIRLLPNNCYPIGKDNLVEIEVKQKEDMEGKKIHLKPFDLESAKSGNPVRTRDGRKARIICFDKIGCYPVIALVQEEGMEMCHFYTKDGKCADSENNNDLMILPEKKEGWVNVYKDGDNNYRSTIYTNEKVALSRKGSACLATVKIEWEE